MCALVARRTRTTILLIESSQLPAAVPVLGRAVLGVHAHTWDTNKCALQPCDGFVCGRLRSNSDCRNPFISRGICTLHSTQTRTHRRSQKASRSSRTACRINYAPMIGQSVACLFKNSDKLAPMHAHTTHATRAYKPSTHTSLNRFELTISSIIHT